MYTLTATSSTKPGRCGGQIKMQISTMLRRAACGLFLLATIACAHADGWQAHWDARYAMIGLQATQAGARPVLLVGDSNTESLWRPRTGSCNLINAGFGGAAIGDIAKMAPGLAAATHPSIVHIMLGGNNLWMNPSDSALVQAQMLSIIQAFQAVGAQVVMWPMFPYSAAGIVGFPPVPPGNRALVNSIMQAAAWQAGTYWWDWWFPQQFEDVNGFATPGAVVADGVHMSASSQAARVARIDQWNQYIAAQTGMACQ